MKKNSTKIESEADLFLLIRENNRDGLDYLYEHYSSILYGLALRAVGSQEYTEKIVQVTFVKAWHSIEKYKLQKGSFKGWLIQLLISSIREFLDSKNITYVLKTNQFPNFNFEFSEQ